MAKKLTPIDHEERLSLVEHLDELRSRIIVSLLAVAVAFAVAFWQNKRLLAFLARPVKRVLKSEAAKGEGPEGQASETTKALRSLGHAVASFAKTVASPHSGASAAVRHGAVSLDQAAVHVDRTLHLGVGTNLYTFGVGEPFTISVTVAMYFSILIAMPVILFQLYAFVLPAFSPKERAVALPILLLLALAKVRKKEE